MCTRSLLPTLLGLSLALGACDNEPTQPSASPAPSGPELAVAFGSWITRANMPVNRQDPAIATVTNGGGQSVVYVIGGVNPGMGPTRSLMAYNVATNTWTFRRQLPVPLGGTNGAAVINGKIYVSGGYSDYAENFPSKRLYMYDPGTNTWTRKSDMPETTVDDGNNRLWVGGHGATGVIDGKLYVVTPCAQSNEPWGVYEGCGGHPAPWFFRYNPVTNRWTTLRSPFVNATDPPLSPYMGGVVGGKLYVMTGNRSVGRLAAYDPATNQWTSRTPLGLGRPGAATAVLGGKLYVMGGKRWNAALQTYETLDITIVYDPATDAWTRRASLPSARGHIAASKVFLNGGSRIELVGGNLPGNNLQYVP
jgi:N-acetylneuraminic acid mutarotase